jgi:hypothetical protein
MSDKLHTGDPPDKIKEAKQRAAKKRYAYAEKVLLRLFGVKGEK